ncbi:DUF1810 domain-containing protein [Sphingomonas sp. R-74633]|uniref:DUF1810 domain-containing protein n=1 Tax=Sphingomonas sp. R-74633 TaxID=2751188 RepID=UPI0015D32440|nr:DUF1810 domain-containing protein [Sphingomonas sp. R-74633]
MTAAADSLERFVEAQAPVYAAALAEIRRGAKRSHWMWFVFPQLAGLGRSETARFFGVRSIEEARAYLAHPLLGKRYFECVAALQDLVTSDSVAVFGEVDAVKLRSSLTLFEAVEPSPLLAAALDRWFAGARDMATLALLED